MAKQTNKLTASTVKNLAYDPNSKNKYADGGGLYLLIHEKGSKYWRLDYRRPISQKRNTLALGTLDNISLKEARLKRDEAKRMLADGIDPAEERNNYRNDLKAKLENTFEKFSVEWLKIRELEGKVDRETIRKMNRDILPFIGKKPVTDLTVEQLENDVTNSLVERGALESARRVKSIMGMVLKLPFKRRLITYNPAYDITLPKPIKGNHNAVVSESELKTMLQKIWRYHAENPRARLRTELALKLSAYIYQRPNEIRELLWEYVDFENQRLCFRASKTHQEHIVPLSRQAFDILKQLEDTRTTSKFVFPSVKSPHESMSEDTIRQALNRLGYKGKHTAHGFRATARTILGEELEYRIDIIEHQLAHTVRDPNGTAYMLLNSSWKFLTVSDKTRTQDINTLLDAYQKRVQVNADAWSSIEAEFLSNISSYCLDKHVEFKNDELHQKGYSIKFTPIKIKAVIDWVDLTFEVNPSTCKFADKPNARSYIKSFLTSKTGTKHYIKHDESDIDQQGLAFTIRLHDIRNNEDLLKITHLLATQYGADYLQMKISSIELSLDFYNVPSRAFLSALHKSLKYSKTAENFRIYKYMKDDVRNKFTPIPKSPLLLLDRFNNDWCLGVNPKGSPLCYRLYPKTTDSNKQALPMNEHRLRVEVTLNSEMLKNTDCHLSNLPNIIKLGFKHLTFTKLDEKASDEMKANYNQNIEHFGMEQNTISVNRNKRTLTEGIKTLSELNSLVAKAIFNLCRQF